MRAKQFTEAALGVSPKREKRPGSRPDRGHEPQNRYGISADKETQFHAKLDKLVHNTFGKRDDELEEYGDTAKGQKMLTKVQKRAVDRVTSKKADTDPAYAKKNKDTADRAWDRMTDKDLEESGNDDLDNYDVGGLQGYYSDFHKDLHGFRPRHHSEEEFNNPEKLKELIRGLHKYMDALKKTPEGRAQLKADGWHFDDEPVDEIAGAFPSPSTRKYWADQAAASNAAEAKRQAELKAKADAERLKTNTELVDKEQKVNYHSLDSQPVPPKPVNEGKTVKTEPSKPRNFVAKNAINTGAGAHKDKKKAEKQGDFKHKKQAIPMDEAMEALEAAFKEEKAPRALCISSKPDEDLGASQLASCKSQGLRARDGNKSHKLGKSPKSRVKVGGKRIKGNKYGGPLPDWS